MAKETETKTPKRGVGNAATDAIKAGMTNEDALAAAKAEFPDAKTSIASINWYRNKLRSDGNKSVKTNRELKAAAKKAAVKAEKAAAKADPLAD